MIESMINIGGAVVFWTAAEFTDRSRLAAGLQALGLERFVPDPRPEAGILRDALEDVFGGSRILVRPLADRDGFAVVQEDRGRADNAYATVLVARVAGTNPVRFDFQPQASCIGQVEESYRQHADRIPAAQLSACLVKVVESLGGTRLRPTGAVYWVPGPRLDDWMAVARVVEAAADRKPSSVYLLRHHFDVESVRAVRDAVVAEVRGEVKRIRDEVDSGELGPRALETRQAQARDLREKVLLYEDLLNVGLADLHRSVDAADQAAATAALLLGASATGSNRSSSSLVAC
jgi:hypothetical protein